MRSELNVKYGTGVALVLSLGTSVFAQTAPQQKVFPFELNQVTLLPSPFKSAMDRTLNYLLFINSDRMLLPYRDNYGLPNPAGVKRYGGWETGALRGHTMGHFLTALSQAYQSTGNVKFKEKANSLVIELQKCQKAATNAGYHTGYLASFSEGRFDTLLTGGPSIRCPFYILDKTLEGLLNCYRLLHDSTALDMAVKIGDWSATKLSPYTAKQLDVFWEDKSKGSGEYGAFNANLVDLAKITGDTKYVTTAKLFDHTELFNPLISGSDPLKDRHANTHIPRVFGAMKIYEQSGETNYLKVAQNFQSMVTKDHSYINGGNSVHEYFRASKAIASYLTFETNETCNVYNMLKLTRELYLYDPQASYMDYYERALYNQILASQDTVSANSHVTYFIPMVPGGIKVYGDDENTFKCCQGTGLENHTKYGSSIFFRSMDTLIVNLFIPSQLNWNEKNLTVKMETRYPDSDSIKISLTGSGTVPLKIRAPFWLRRSISVKVNGIGQSLTVTPGSYFTVSVPILGTGTVDLVLPQTIHFETAPDDATVGGAMYGAQVLAGGFGKDTLNTMTSLDASTVKKNTSESATFTATAGTGNVALVPFFRMHNQHYSVYWKLNKIPSDPFITTAIHLNPVSGVLPSNFTTIRWTQEHVNLWIPNIQVGDLIRLRKLNGTVLLNHRILNKASDIVLTLPEGSYGPIMVFEWSRNGKINVSQTIYQN
jgi:uncharacterized protein